MSYIFTGQTVRTFVYQSLNSLGVIGAGQAPTSYQTNNGVYLMNEILDGYNIKGAMMYSMQYLTLDITSTQESYTIGPGLGADLYAETAPVYVEFATYYLNNNTPFTEVPMILISADEYASIRMKSAQSPIASYLYYRPGVPNGTLYVWPVPYNPSKMVLTFWTPFNSNMGVNDIITLPPGYAQMLRYDLIAKMALQYGMPIPTDVVSVYADAKNDITYVNARSSAVAYPAGLPRQGALYNVYTDQSSKY
jgi:hypothetical protein